MCRVATKQCAVDQHKVARLPVGKIDRRDTNCVGFNASPSKSGRTPKEEEPFHDVLAV
jgi:hypothetical protein